MQIQLGLDPIIKVETKFLFTLRRASLSIRITESILAVILITSKYENQFLSLSHTVNAAVSVKFDSCELRLT